MDKVRVAAVSYLNTKPFLYGLEHSDLINEVDLSLEIPSKCLELLTSGNVDLALVPVTAIPLLDEPRVVSNYCIGSNGKVQTVCLFSKVPLQEIERVMLDYQSSTSVALTRILAKDHWKIEPEFVAAEPGFENQISGTTAGLVIGDRAIAQLDSHPFVYDLGEEWQEHTGLPFVFAAWVSRVDLPDGFMGRFNAALDFGLANIPAVIDAHDHLFASGQFDLAQYFESHISFDLDPAKRQGLDRFLHTLTGRMIEVIR
jgi:chorismate dehydratase